MSETLDRLWADDRNWLMGRIYVCREDPRLVVRGRDLLTFYTLNFAHKTSYLVLAVSAAIIIGGLAIVRLVHASTLGSVIGMFAALALVFLFQAILARSSD